MIKGLAITPPVLGRISIGRVIEKNGKRLPEKDDQFTLTTQVQGKDGWLAHPLDEQLRKEFGIEKLRCIPVRMPFNDPDLNLRSEYSLFDRNSGRPLCVGNGETCRRVTHEGIQSFPCPSPDGCELAKGGTCKPYGRLNVKIGDVDDLGTFIFRTAGFNSIRTLTARLTYYNAVSGNALSCMPLELRLRSKSTTQSYRTPFYYADICIREGKTLEEALREATILNAKRKEAGFDQEALDAVARQGIRNGAFEESTEDMPEILEEYFLASEERNATKKRYRILPNQVKPSLKDRLELRATQTESI